MGKFKKGDFVYLNPKEKYILIKSVGRLYSENQMKKMIDDDDAYPEFFENGVEVQSVDLSYIFLREMGDEFCISRNGIKFWIKKSYVVRTERAT